MALNWREKLLTACPQGNVQFDVPMSSQTSMRVGGPADALVAARSEGELLAALGFARKEGLPLFVMGRGSNLIVRGGGIRGVVLQLAMEGLRIDGVHIHVEAGNKLPMLAREAMQKNLAGLEFAQGIPGSVGGGVVMNAGAYDGQMADLLHRVRYVDENLQVGEREADAEDFGYRSSVYADRGWIVLSAELTLKRDMDGSARKRFDQYRKLRQEKQPLEHPSAGSVFKRPAGHYAGALIEEAGLKGLRMGGAVVSQKHAGFIVNDGNASADDVITLIEEVQRRVLENSGVALEREVKIIGED